MMMNSKNKQPPWPIESRQSHHVYMQCIDSLIKEKKYTKGAELGVKSGRSTVALLHHNPKLHMIAVDLWSPHSTIVEKQHDHDKDFKTCLKFIKRFNVEDRVTIIRKLTTEACYDVENESLDFIYIDATHTAEAITSDLKAWIPKVKSSGAICGHDYAPRFGIIPIIDSLGTREKGYIDEGKTPSWWILKKDINSKWLL